MTFGVEIEFILAVHGEEFAPRGFAWLYAPGTSDTEERKFNLRAYRSLILASRILEHDGLDNVVAYGTHTDVQRWGVVQEVTAAPKGWNEIIKFLPDRVLTSTLDQWSAYGVELVSRVLKAPDHVHTRVLHFDPALAEIKRYMTTLRGNYNTPWGAFVNQSCGLHVHIGLDPKLSDACSLPLDVLQHLSYMLVMFETSISALHPRGRRALADTRFSTGSMLDSNLMGVRKARHICDKVPLPLLEQIQDRIFGEDMTIEELAVLMSQTMKGDTDIGRYRQIQVRQLHKADG